MKKQRRVAIVYPAGNLDMVPSLYNAAVLIAEHGYLVDVFTCFDSTHVQPSFQDRRISILPASISGQRERTMSWRFLTRGLGLLLHLVLRHLCAPYVCVIGVDPPGLIRAQRLIRRWLKVPLAYYSLELWPSYDLVTEQERERKIQEKILSQQAAFVIIQDKERADLLARDNQLSPNRIICVPNAPLGSARRGHSNYLREKFDLPPDVKIVLHAGSLGTWTCILPLIRSTQDWPDDWVLICHSHTKADAQNSDYVAALRYLAKPGRVLFSTDPLPSYRYPELVQSADIGVAFYCPQPGVAHMQDNIRHIGLSSGKVAYYLQAGLPIIVNKIPSLMNLVTTYRCGEVVEDPAQTRPAIELVLSDFPTYSANALRCFDQEFDFAGRFAQVLTTLDSLS